MTAFSSLIFKVASEEWEFEQIYQLNYRFFVELIPQHDPNPDRKLIDKYHKENTYFICLRDKKLLGMICVRDKRPFSLDEKLENLDAYLPQAHSICEIRLLAVEKNCATSRVFFGLMTRVAQYFEKQRYDLAIISGSVKQLNLYKHLGFVPFGPVVGTNDAQFQPMYYTSEALEKIKNRSKTFSHSLLALSSISNHLNFLPGPVRVSQKVQRAFRDVPVSHRSDKFIADFQQTKRLLCHLVGAQNVEIFMGSGTLANDVITAQISLKSEHGLILSNGEFGERLINHATRLGLSFETLQTIWGGIFKRKDIKSILDKNHKIRWIWAVHCESSTGVLNDIDMLKEFCTDREIQLCLDCVSSIGTIPIDLQGVYLASGVSGKGLGAFPGLSMVFYNHQIHSSQKLPRYLDLGFYAANQGVPFTVSSNLVYALMKALENFPPKRYYFISTLSAWLRARLREMGFSILAPDAYASPAITTITLPKQMSSEKVGQRLKEAGYLLSYRSQYLLRHNWLQISLMGKCSRESIAALLYMLQDYAPGKDSIG